VVRHAIASVCPYRGWQLIAIHVRFDHVHLGILTFPGGWWEECCHEHDRCYSRGGDALDRLICDFKLFTCMQEKGAGLIADAYCIAVVLFGWFAFNWGGEQPPQPQPCTGHCVGVEMRYEDLRDFETTTFNYQQVVAFVSPRGRALLLEEASLRSGIRETKSCARGCRCTWTDASEWRRSTDHLSVPTGDTLSRCTATVWIRDHIGNCSR
jgi:hypothetical protein